MNNETKLVVIVATLAALGIFAIISSAIYFSPKPPEQVFAKDQHVVTVCYLNTTPGYGSVQDGYITREISGWYITKECVNRNLTILSSQYEGFVGSSDLVTSGINSKIYIKYNFKDLQPIPLYGESTVGDDV